MTSRLGALEAGPNMAQSATVTIKAGGRPVMVRITTLDHPKLAAKGDVQPDEVSRKLWPGDSGTWSLGPLRRLEAVEV